MPRLADKIALITGAETGIGRAAARAMATAGARIVVAEINAAAGEQTAHITMTDRVRGRLDIANMAVFLASDEARMITGHVYPVDSGITIS
jgi:NAD(P)-dependent dehydrogenase (short-subunit alcohol dehydrogenase family)